MKLNNRHEYGKMNFREKGRISEIGGDKRQHERLAECIFYTCTKLPRTSFCQ